MAPRQQELDDAKTYLTGSFPLAFASNAGIASQLSTFQRQGLAIGYVASRNALIEAVTLDDVKRVAETVVRSRAPDRGRRRQRPNRIPSRRWPSRQKQPSKPATAAIASRRRKRRDSR